jgi:hypothetical protein
MGCIAALTSIDPAVLVAVVVPIVHFGAMIIVALTHTPAPGSTWAKAYRVIEIVAGVVGRAKESGQLPHAPGHLDELETQGAELLHRLKASQ